MGELPPDAAERYARAYCKAVFECDCSITTFDSEDECVEDQRTRLQELIDFGLDNGMEPNVGCYDSMLETLEESPCSQVEYTVSDWPRGRPDFRDGFDCELFERSEKAKPVGSPCEQHYHYGFEIHECAGDDPYCSSQSPDAQGGICRNSLNIDDLVVVGLGEPCTAPMTICGPVTELYCDRLDTGTCQPMADEGESCPHLWACNRSFETDHTHYCKGEFIDGDGICTPRALNGESCDFRDENPCAIYYNSSPDTQYDCIDGVCQPQTQVRVCRAERNRMWLEERAKAAE